MKRIIYTLFISAFFCVLAMAQVPKKILVEETTQASCPPCATLNPAFDALMEANTDKVVVMKYQVWWPGYDPMYEENVTDVNERVGNYLGANAAPNIYVNGGGFESITSITQSRIDQMTTPTSPLRITIDHTINDVNGTVDIEVTVANESANEFPANTHRLQTVMTEDEILFAQPPGTTSERDFKWVMRKMLPDANGTMITEAIPAGGSQVFTYSHPILWYTKDLGKVAVSAWVENPVTHDVVQAEHSEHKALVGTFPDLATNYQIAGYDGLCDDVVDAEFMVRNAGTEEVTSFDINAVNPDGSLSLVQSWTGSIMAGASETVVVSGLTLASGANALRAVITNIDGKPDKNGFNAQMDNTVYYKVADTPWGTEITEGFDITLLREVPENMIFIQTSVPIVTANSTHIGGFNDPLGGFGNSDGAVWFDFPVAAPGSEATMLFEKIDLTDSENTTLNFNYAYALRGTNGADRMMIQASADCGENWVDLWSVIGADVTTAPATPANTRFFPRPNQWGASDTLDMSSMDGEGEVLLRFHGLSGGAQAFWFDDIVVQSNPISSVADDKLKASMNIFPNPSADVVNIEFALENSSTVNINVLDVTGKVVDVITQSAVMPRGINNLTWTPQTSGIFMIQIQTENAISSSPITIVK